MVQTYAMTLPPSKGCLGGSSWLAIYSLKPAKCVLPNITTPLPSGRWQLTQVELSERLICFSVAGLRSWYLQPCFSIASFLWGSYPVYCNWLAISVDFYDAIEPFLGVIKAFQLDLWGATIQAESPSETGHYHTLSRSKSMLWMLFFPPNRWG